MELNRPIHTKRSSNNNTGDIRMRKSVSYKVGRDAKTGRFLPINVAKRRKSTAVIVTIKRDLKMNKGFKKNMKKKTH